MPKYFVYALLLVISTNSAAQPKLEKQANLVEEVGLNSEYEKIKNQKGIYH